MVLPFKGFRGRTVVEFAFTLTPVGYIAIIWCSIPFNAMFARRGLTTPPCGVPCSGNSAFIPAFKHRKIPSFRQEGAIKLSIIELCEILSKHFSISSSITLLSIPFALEFRFENRYFCASCAERPVLNP